MKMKITKYVHSCLLVETPDRACVIDPGRYSWASGSFDVARLKRLDNIVITHEHGDHMHLPFVQALVAKFPDVQVTSTPAAAKLLISAGLMNVGDQSSEGIELFAAAHESNVPLGSPPKHTGVHVLDRLTHPGDSHHFAGSKEILALPVTSGWGTQGAAAALATELKPKYVIPIHDWMWNEQARVKYYDLFERYFESQGISFIRPKDGVAFEL